MDRSIPGPVGVIFVVCMIVGVAAVSLIVLTLLLIALGNIEV